MKILTPAPKVLVLLDSASKSLKISSAALRKAYPAVCIQVFSPLIQPTPSQIISNSTNKNKTELFRLRLTVYPVFAFQTGNAPIFKHQQRIQFPYQPIKFCLRFFLSAFEIIGDSACWMRAENSGIQTDGCATPLFPEYDFHSIVSGCFRIFSPVPRPRQIQI